MNILIPIAGSNENIDQQDYIKSLYEIQNKIMIQYICESLGQIETSQFIFVIKREDEIKYHFDRTIKLMIPDAKIIIAEGQTNGSACSCLLAVDYIDNDEPLLISGSDQLITNNWNEIIDEFMVKDFDGGVVIFDGIHPRWSYVNIDSTGMVTEAAEKRPISRNATTGQYYYRKGSDFVVAAKKMILKGASVNNQYYVCPAFNEMILEHKKIGVYKTTSENYFSLKDKKRISEYEQYLIKVTNDENIQSK